MISFRLTIILISEKHLIATLEPFFHKFIWSLIFIGKGGIICKIMD